MDKELLRVVIVLIGLLAMVSILLWHSFKTWRQQEEPQDDEDDGEYDDEDFDDENEFERFSEKSESDQDVLFEGYQKAGAKQSAAAVDPVKSAKPHLELPKLIEFSVVARADQGFNGEELYDAFERAKLVYGSVRVFERIDKNRLVDYAVASMINPGTFPDKDIENFYCPGIVFFMQPREVDQPLVVFNDFIDTINYLAEELDGVVWDNQRQPLTPETIDQFRQMLK